MYTIWSFRISVQEKKNLYPTANVLAHNFFYIVSYLKTHGDAQTNDLQNIDFFYRFLHILYLVSKDEKMNFWKNTVFKNK